MALTEEKIRNTYSKLVMYAQKCLKKGDIQRALKYIHLASYTDHTFYLSFYDPVLEQLTKNIANQVTSEDSYKTTTNRCVMLDSLGCYRGGLAVQYIKAIVSSGWDLLYVTSQEIDAPQRRELKEFLTSLRNVSILEVSHDKTGMDRLNETYQKIMDYAPSKLYVHINAYDAFFTTIAYSLPSNIHKFFIDITDHASQLGYLSCEKSFEFRELGCSNAITHRGANTDKLLYLPFYPIVDNVSFKGLPEMCKGKKIILSGGRYFKIIDADDTFFKLIRRIMDDNQDAVLLFPGCEDDTMIKSKIRQYSLENQFLLLGWRDDISELFRHSDVFLNTYPHGGGTMAQYAAHLKVPILSFKPDGPCPNPVECFVCQDGYTNISSVGVDEFHQEANRLLNDRKYAKQKAQRVYECILGEEKFNAYFKQMSETGHNIIPFDIDKASFLDKKQRSKFIAYQNIVGEYQTRLVAFCGINEITFDKDYLLMFAKRIIPKIKKVVIQRGFHLNRI